MNKYLILLWFDAPCKGECIIENKIKKHWYDWGEGTNAWRVTENIIISFPFNK